MGTKKFQESYLDMLLLKLQSQKDMYGYEIIQEIRERSSEAFFSEGGNAVSAASPAGAGRVSGHL